MHGIQSLNHIITHGYTGHAMLLCVPLFTCLHVSRSGVAGGQVHCDREDIVLRFKCLFVSFTKQQQDGL